MNTSLLFLGTTRSYLESTSLPLLGTKAPFLEPATRFLETTGPFLEPAPRFLETKARFLETALTRGPGFWKRSWFWKRGHKEGRFWNWPKISKIRHAESAC